MQIVSFKGNNYRVEPEPEGHFCKGCAFNGNFSDCQAINAELRDTERNTCADSDSIFVLVEERMQETPVSTPSEIDKHYDFEYTINPNDIHSGCIRVDPYFIARQWKLGEKDNSGVIFHILKTIARFGCKNTVEREIKAIYKSIKRLAELEGVKLD